MAVGGINDIIIQALPIIRSLLLVLGGGVMVVAMAYYLFVIKMRRKWHVTLWEQKADGKIHEVGHDKLVEKKINKGKQIVYLLTKRSVEVIPPPYSSIHRFKNKEKVNYLRIRDEFIPLDKVMKTNVSKDKDTTKTWIKSLREATAKIRTMSKSEVEAQYVYAPINEKLCAGLIFQPMDYDVNLMRIHALDNRAKIYTDKLDFFSTYGQIIALGLIVVLIIVVMYFSYDYSAQVIGTAMGKADATLKLAEQVALRVASGGVVPPS